MNIKRFTAPDMRRAIAQVRNEHGPDAVILSSEAVAGGVEIIAAIDYDQALLERMMPGAEAPAVPATASGEASAGSAQSPESPVGGAASAASSAPPTSTAKPTAESAPAATPSTTTTTQPSAAPKILTPTAGSHLATLAAAAAAPSADSPALAADSLDTMRRELQTLKGMLREQFARLSWADMRAFDPERALLTRRVEALGLEPRLVETLIGEVEHPEEPARAWREIMFALARRITVMREDPLEQGGVFALIGPTGVGKTTTLAKLAARHCLRFGRDSLALITTDSYRVGAQRQLDAFGAILGVPVRRVDSTAGLARQLIELADRRLVLIDTAGMAPRDRRLAESLAQLETAANLRRYLVLPANMQASAMQDAVQWFGRGDLAGVAITKLDEANGLGAALSVLIAESLPVVWLSEGQRVPEDLKLARIAHLLKWASGAPLADGAAADIADDGAPHAHA